MEAGAMRKNSTKRSTTLATLKLYMAENLRHKSMFFGTVFTWTSGMFLQKLLLPIIIAGVIDSLIRMSNMGDYAPEEFIRPLLYFLAAMLTAQLLIDVGLVLLSRLETRVMTRLYDKIFNHLLGQSMHFHNNSFSGSLVSQSNRFVSGYVAVTDTFIINLTQLVIFVVFASAVILFYSPLIALTLVSWSAVFIYVNIVLTRRRIRLSRERAAADTKVTGRLADAVSNIGVIKTYSAEKFEQDKFHDLAQDRASKGYRYWIRSIQNDAVYGILMGLLQVLVLGVSIFAVMHSDITIGTFLLVQVYVTQAIAYLWGLSHVTKNLEQNLSDASEMTEILKTPPLIKDPKQPEKPKIHRGMIDIHNATFQHDNANIPLFKNFSLRIKPGEKVGLVGKSGSGKTSLVSLLLRFSDLISGQILIDGQDISRITQSDLRQQIAHVPQEPLLFHRSLSENIAYGRHDASQAEVQAIARLANAQEFIDKLPEKYETLVGERGVKLSGGQRQRIAIARAMLKNAPILVLDEATSALDSESEVLIQDALWKLMEGRTAIVIAHRLSTIQKMDRIIVMDKGKIAEQGTHKELIRKNGIYASLWSHQSGGFIED